VLHIAIWGIEAFSAVLSGDETGILGPLRQRAPPIGGYGVLLIRLWWCVHSALSQMRINLRRKHSTECSCSNTNELINISSNKKHVSHIAARAVVLNVFPHYSLSNSRHSFSHTTNQKINEGCQNKIRVLFNSKLTTLRQADTKPIEFI